MDCGLQMDHDSTDCRLPAALPALPICLYVDPGFLPGGHVLAEHHAAAVHVFHEPGSPEEYADRGLCHDDPRHRDRLPAGLARRAHGPVREKVLPLAVYPDLYGAAVCRGHGMAAPDESECRHDQPVAPGDFPPQRCAGTAQCLHAARHDLGAHHLLLSLCLYHHQPRDGKDGSVAGRGEPHFRRFPGQNAPDGDTAHDDALADRRCTPGVYQRGELLRDSLDYRYPRQCQYGDYPHCRVCRAGTDRHE